VTATVNGGGHPRDARGVGAMTAAKIRDLRA
jgi:hypothetical protein